jgi:hypothetical protein
MWRARRRRESPAADAIADLIEAGIVEKRGHASPPIWGPDNGE